MKKTLMLFAAFTAGFTAISASTPYPYVESFADGVYSGAEWTVETLEGEASTVRITPYNTLTGIQSYGRDGGFIVCENDKAGTILIATPEVTMPKHPSDQCSIYFLYYCDPVFELHDMMHNIDNNGWEKDTQVWTSSEKRMSSFQRYANSLKCNTLRIGFKITTTGTGEPFIIDEFAIADIDKYDMGMSGYGCPSEYVPGEPLSIDFFTQCHGLLRANGYRIDLYLDNKIIASETGAAAWRGNDATNVVQFTPTVDSPETLNMRAVLVMPDGLTDADLSDNEIDDIVITRRANLLPRPANVKGEKNSGVVTLSWDTPDKESNNERTVDDLESLEALSTGGISALYDVINGVKTLVKMYSDEGQLGAYRVIDADHTPDMTGNGEIGGAASCTVIDFSGQSANRAASGSKALVFWPTADGTASDNYLVLPRIDDTDRTISFKAAATDASRPETFIPLISMAGNTRNDFIPLEEPVTVTSSEYSGYTYSLPEGATYFAIRHTTTGGAGLLVDDISYKAGQPAAVNHYNIYADGKMINNSPVTSTSYETPAGAQNFRVTAVYAEGESNPSESWSDPTEISTVDTTESAVVNTVHGSIIISGSHGKRTTVYRIDGTEAASAIGDTAISVTTGIYIVRIGDTTFKVAVK